MKELMIIPAYNESATLPTVLGELRALEACPDVLVVDDASTDGTAAICRAAGANVITLPLNLGIAGAVKAGYKYAVEHGYGIAVQFDSDGQHDPVYIDAVLDPIRNGDAEMVIGSRFITREGYQSEFSRRIGIKLFSWITSAIIHRTVTDITSGYRAIGGGLLKTFARDYPVKHPDAEAIILAHRLGFKILEVPVVMKPRVSGKSFFNLSRKLIYPLNTLVSIIATTLRSSRHYGE